MWRTVHGVKVPVCGSKAVDNYVEGFFTQLANMLEHVNYVEVRVLDRVREVEAVRMAVGVQDELVEGSPVQKALEMKGFISRMLEMVGERPAMESDGTWALYVGYRLEQKSQ